MIFVREKRLQYYEMMLYFIFIRNVWGAETVRKLKNS